MKKLYAMLIVIAALSSSLPATAQFKLQQNTTRLGAMKGIPADEAGGRAQNVFIEIGGQGLLLTANYDTRFSNRRDGFGGRIGIGYIGDGETNATTIPLSLNYLLGNGGKHFFEIGLGATIIASKMTGSFFFDDGSTNKNSSVIGTTSFSYRLQPVNNGFSLRAGVTPLFNDDFFFPFFGGLSLGYTF